MFFVGVLALAAVCASTTGTGEGSGCITSPAVVGGRGAMTFTFRSDLDMTSDAFHAYVIRDGQTANVVQCDRRDQTGITCDTINKAFNPTSIVNYTLTLTADNVNLDLAGVYTLWTMVGGSREPPVECTFVVKKGTTAGDTTDVLAIGIAVPVVVIAVVAMSVVGFFLYKKRKRQKKGRDNQQNETREMLSLDGTDGHPEDCQSKRWYFEQTSYNFEAKLTEFWKNGKGSFLIAKDHDNFFTLAVCDEEGNNNRPRITKTDSGYQVDDTRKTFPTLTKLVAYYKKHDLVCGESNYGKLKKPFEEKPEGVWYAEKLKRHEAETLLKSKAPGSFLIKDSHSKPEFYTLAVNVNGRVETFRISLDDESFILVDARGRKRFKSLAQLVEHYQKNTLNTVRGDKGKLSQPVKVPEDGEED